jgi:hypothetical protein
VGEKQLGMIWGGLLYSLQVLGLARITHARMSLECLLSVRPRTIFTQADSPPRNRHSYLQSVNVDPLLGTCGKSC